MYPSPHDLEKKIPSVPDDQQQVSEPLLEVKEHHAANVEIVSALDNVEGKTPEQSCFERFCRGLLFVLCSALAIIPLFWPFYWKVLNQYQRAVLFRFGELQRPARLDQKCILSLSLFPSCTQAYTITVALACYSSSH